MPEPRFKDDSLESAVAQNSELARLISGGPWGALKVIKIERNEKTGEGKPSGWLLTYEE